MSDPALVLRGWDPLYTRYFPFSTLRSLGYRTRVSAYNGSDALGARREPLDVRLSLFAADGTALLRAAPCAVIEPGEYWMLDDVETFADGHGLRTGSAETELVGVLHQTPLSQRDAAAARGGVIDATVGEIAPWLSFADDFVEYFDDRTGGTGGVFYYGPFLNDTRLAPTWSTVVQSPKALFDDHLEPGLLLVNVASDPRHDRSAVMDIALFGMAGERIGQGGAVVPAFASRLVRLRGLLADGAYKGGATVLAVSTTATVIPCTLVHDRRSMALAIDHTFPPANYHSAWGQKKKRATWATEVREKLVAAGA